MNSETEELLRIIKTNIIWIEGLKACSSAEDVDKWIYDHEDQLIFFGEKLWDQICFYATVD